MLILSLPGAERLALPVAQALACPHQPVEVHRFPDGEWLPRLTGSVAGQDVALFAALDRPDARLLPLLFAADAARDLGARRVTLVAPYLPYLRQDTRFREGEAVTSRTFARLVSSCFDGLLTFDPHLHRFHRLEEIYSLRARALSAAEAVAGWVRREVREPVLVGPDEESAQWVRTAASLLGAPWRVMRKDRRGDRDVTVSLAGEALPEGCAAVLVDDMASTGRTLAAAAQALAAAGHAPAACVVVHALFGDADGEELRRAGIARIASCDTVAHPTNGINVAPLLARALAELRASA
jgi:ribose-phosphate pyrophosphokinase